MPIGLRGLFPHDDVEGRGVLVAEDEASIVVVNLSVDEERAAEVHTAERVVACTNTHMAGIRLCREHM